MTGHVAVSRKGGTLGGVFGSASSECARADKDKPREKKERADYVSLRVTPEEKDLLTRDAAGMSLSAYVRGRLFGEAARPRKTRGKYPVKDHEALARVLGRLGRSNLHNTLHRLMLAVEEGTGAAGKRA